MGSSERLTGRPERGPFKLSGSVLPASGNGSLFCAWFSGAQILMALARMPWTRPLPHTTLESRSPGT